MEVTPEESQAAEGIHQRSKKLHPQPQAPQRTRPREYFDLPMTADQFPRRNSWKRRILYAILAVLVIFLIYYLSKSSTQASWSSDRLPVLRSRYKYF